LNEHPHSWRDGVADHLDIWTTSNDGHRRLRGLAPKHVRATVFCDAEFSGFGKTFFFLDVAAIRVSANGAVDVYESKVHMDSYAARFADPKALEIIGYNESEWADAPPATVVLPRLLEHVWGAQWVGHNAEADVLRLATWWTSNGYPCPHGFTFPIMDTESLARAMLPGLSGYSLADLCQHFGIPEETQHRALSGAERVRACWTKLTARD
jgi:DNA polymerase III epsilon subunit-like protein